MIAAATVPKPSVPEPSQGHLTCVVIGPAGDRNAYDAGLEVYQRIVRPACATLGLRPLRSDPAQPDELRYRQVLGADIVIADVTDGRPSVMYELGLRHTTGRPTLQIGERNRQPPGLPRTGRVVFERSETGLAHARRDLQGALVRALRDGFTPFLPVRILLGLRPRQEPTPTAVTTPTNLFATFQTTMPPLTEGLKAVTGLVNDIAALAEEARAGPGYRTGRHGSRTPQHRDRPPRRGTQVLRCGVRRADSRHRCRRTHRAQQTRPPPTDPRQHPEP